MIKIYLYVNRMRDREKTKDQLTRELTALRQRIGELEEFETYDNQVKQVLWESEEKYRTVLESIGEGFYEVDLAGNFPFFNDPCAESMGTQERH
jgi:PAS domain-containing protein